jgi:hypothetical protein
MSDQSSPDPQPELNVDFRLLLLLRARVLNRELLDRFSSAEEDFERGRHHAVLGSVVLAEIQLAHMRSLLRVLET